jgi:hypothetical protein
MSSLTNQQSSTKSLTGLSNTYSTDITCNNFTCDTSFTISPGCVITLPANSIPDSALSTNVAFRNEANTFTQSNIFNGATDFNLRTKNFAYSAVVFPADFRALDSTQTYPTQWYQNGTLSQIQANYNGGTIQFGTKTPGGVSLEHIIIRNGNETVLQGSSNELQILGTSINMNGICSFTNTTTPVITQAIALSDNTTKIATTAFVKGQGYALLAPTTQTFSGNNNFPTQLTTDNSTLVATTAYVKNQGYITSSSLTGYALLAPSTTQTFAGTASTNFTNSAIFSVGLQSNNNITLYSIGGGGQTSNIQQNNSGLNIGNVDISKYITLTTRTSGGANVVGVSCANGNSSYLQGDSGAQISITGQLANIGGTSVPTITTQPLSGSNTNEIASTAWATTKLSGYATLNLNNTFNGLNYFNKAVEFKDVVPQPPVIVKNTVSSNSGGLLISGGGSYNGINDTGYFSVIGFGPTADTGTLTLTTWASGYVGIKIDATTIKYNSPFQCNYNTLVTLPTKVNQDIGYIWSIAGTSFTSWNGYTTPGNVYTIAWNGTGDKTIGVWRMDISLVTNTATTMTCGLNVNVVNGTSFSSNTRTVFDSSASGAFVGYQVLRLSTTLDIQNLTTTYYINFQRTGGSGLSDNTGASQIQFTRIA